MSASASSSAASAASASSASVAPPMTRYELLIEIQKEKNLRHRFMRDRERAHSRVERLLYDIQRLSEKRKIVDKESEKDKYTRHINRALSSVDWWRDYTHDSDTGISRFTQRIAELEAQLAVVGTESAVLTIPVCLLSGEVLSVEVNPTFPVSQFPELFCEQNGYAASATSRMAFFLVDGDSETILWSPEERRGGQTIQDVIGGNDVMVNLVICPPLEDPDKVAKMELVRKIALKNYDTIFKDDTDDELFVIFSEWKLKYIYPPNAPVKSNRFITMKAFVDWYVLN